MLHLLNMAARVALPTNGKDLRNFYVGSVGIRRDNVIVSARNLACVPNAHGGEFKSTPDAHSEVRLIKNKLGKHSEIMAVCRIRRLDGKMAMARPCPSCTNYIRSARVKKVVYSINEHYYGVWDIEQDYDRVIQFRK